MGVGVLVDVALVVAAVLVLVPVAPYTAGPLSSSQPGGMRDAIE